MKTTKAKRLAERVRKLPFRLLKDDVPLVIELCQEHPRWSIDRVLDEATRPKIRSSLIITPTPQTMEALKNWAKKYDVSLPYLINDILIKWCEGIYDK